MTILYVILLTIAIVLLGSISPLFQALILQKKQGKTFKYTFSDDLINRDIELEFKKEFIPRTLLATRGWVRGPQGKIMTNDAFEQKKLEEYSIELP